MDGWEDGGVVVGTCTRTRPFFRALAPAGFILSRWCGSSVATRPLCLATVGSDAACFLCRTDPIYYFVYNLDDCYEHQWS